MRSASAGVPVCICHPDDTVMEVRHILTDGMFGENSRNTVETIQDEQERHHAPTRVAGKRGMGAGTWSEAYLIASGSLNSLAEIRSLCGGTKARSEAYSSYNTSQIGT